MAQLVLSNLEPEILEKLERRAKRLGTTPQSEASRLLRETLRGEPDPSSEAAGNEPTDPRFVRREGFLVFTGAVATEDVPDHRTLREERVESLLKGGDEGRV